VDGHGAGAWRAVLIGALERFMATAQPCGHECDGMDSFSRSLFSRSSKFHRRHCGGAGMGAGSVLGSVCPLGPRQSRRVRGFSKGGLIRLAWLYLALSLVGRMETGVWCESGTNSRQRRSTRAVGFGGGRRSKKEKFGLPADARLSVLRGGRDGPGCTSTAPGDDLFFEAFPRFENADATPHHCQISGIRTVFPRNPCPADCARGTLADGDRNVL